MNSTLQCRRSFARHVAILLILGLVPLASSRAQDQKYPPTIVFMTDFGTVDDSVPICKGVMYSVMPSLRIVDLSHQVTPFSILDGARFLFGATLYYPAGTIFTVVIDPGNCMGDGVFAGGVRQPGLVDAGLLSVTQRLLPRPRTASP